MEYFEPEGQYGDMRGRVTADRHDTVDMNKFLKEKGLLQSGEFLAGIKIFAGLQRGQLADTFFRVSVFLFDGIGYDNFKQAVDSNDTLRMRKVDLDLQPLEFFALFKRFGVSLSPYGTLEGKSITTE